MSKLWKMLLAVLVVAACSEKQNAADNLTIVGRNGNSVQYTVELAQTPEEMRIGLMNRESLAPQTGMIFDLSGVTVPTAMWMKDTKIPLDMLFLDKDGSIFWIYKNAEPESTKLIVSPYQAYAVLEINGGEADKNGIDIGDTVQHELFKKAEPAPVAAAADSNSPADEETVAETTETQTGEEIAAETADAAE